jgi:mxaD protein
MHIFNPHLSRIVIAITAVFLTSGLARAGEQLSVKEAVQLPASPDKVWKLSGNFGGIGAWFPGITKVEITSGKDNHKGAVRVITLKDGTTITEELLDYSASRKTLRYRINTSPLPVRNYVSTYTVKADGKGSKVTWGSTFEQDPAAKLDAAKTREVISGIYTTGFGSLKEKFPAKP